MPEAHRRHAGSAAGRGFTLLELLLALVIVGILSGVLYASLSIAFNARDAAREEVGVRAEATAALELIRGDLAGVLPPTGILAGAMVGADASDVEGYPTDQLTYVTHHAAWPTDARTDRLGDLRSVELRLVTPDRTAGVTEQEQGRHLVREVRTNLLAQTEPQPERQVLARRVVSLEIRYFDGEEWHDTWDSAQGNDTLPSSVAVTLQMLPPEIPPGVRDLEDVLLTAHREFAPLMAPNATRRQLQETR